MTYDVIVVGVGAMGSATVYQLAKRGVKVLGIDRYAPPHDRGSSHGETRITRQGIGEGSAYAPLAVRSHEIWRELEAETGRDLLLTCGFIAIDSSGGTAPMHGKPAFVTASAASAASVGIAHELLSPDETRRRFPQFGLLGCEQIYYEPGGGLVFPELCIAAQLDCASALGASVKTGEAVVSIVPDGEGVRVTTTSGQYSAARVVVSAGGWTPGFASTSLARLKLLRQALHWYVPEQPHRYAATNCPTYIWMHGHRAEDSFYGFPIVPGLTPAVKVAREQYSTTLETPDMLDRAVTIEEQQSMYNDHVAGRLLGLLPQASKSIVCLYTFSPDGNFVIDRDPANSRVLLVSACSGHGFKHSAGVGEHVAQVLTADAELHSDFSIERPVIAQ